MSPQPEKEPRLDAPPWGGYDHVQLMSNLLLTVTPPTIEGEPVPEPVHTLLPRNLPRTVENLSTRVFPPDTKIDIHMFRPAPDPENPGQMAIQPTQAASGSPDEVIRELTSRCVPAPVAFSLLQQQITELMFLSGLEAVSFVAAAESPAGPDEPAVVHGAVVHNAFRSPHSPDGEHPDAKLIEDWKKSSQLVAEGVRNGLMSVADEMTKQYELDKLEQAQIILPGQPGYRPPAPGQLLRASGPPIPPKGGGRRRR